MLNCSFGRNNATDVSFSAQLGKDSVKTLWTQDTLDPRHFGTSAKLSRHIGTSAEAFYGHFVIT